ncbi:hypothetical protein [Bradyrhizobium sp.]
MEPPTEAALSIPLAGARFSGPPFKLCSKDALLSFELDRRRRGFLMANEAYVFGVLTPQAKRCAMAGLRMSGHH